MLTVIVIFTAFMLGVPILVLLQTIVETKISRHEVQELRAEIRRRHEQQQQEEEQES